MAHGLPVDADATDHLVLHLHEIAGVEEAWRDEERVLNAIRVRIQASLLLKCVGLGM